MKHSILNFNMLLWLFPWMLTKCLLSTSPPAHPTHSLHHLQNLSYSCLQPIPPLLAHMHSSLLPQTLFTIISWTDHCHKSSFYSCSSSKGSQLLWTSVYEQLLCFIVLLRWGQVKLVPNLFLTPSPFFSPSFILSFSTLNNFSFFFLFHLLY